jgi:hypothetical protein
VKSQRRSLTAFPWRLCATCWLLVAVLLMSARIGASFAQPHADPEPSTLIAVARRWQFDSVRAQWTPVVQDQVSASNAAAQGVGPKSTDLAISAAWGVQFDPVVAWNDDRGEFLVVWQDGRNGTDLDLYAQRLTSAGQPIGDNFALVVGEHDQWATWVTYRPLLQSYWLVWHHREPGRNCVYVQALTPTGAPKGTALRVVPQDGTQQWIPAVGYNAVSDELLVAWEDMDSSAILGQRVSGAGLLLGETVRISSTPKSQWAPPVVAFNIMLQEYLVVWDDLTEHTITGQIVERDGKLRGSNSIIAGPGSPYVSSAVAGGTNGGYWVFWTDEGARSSGDADIRGQRLTADGTISGESRGVRTTQGSQRDCVAVYDSYHGESVLVWWEGGSATPNNGIHSQRLSWAGEPLGSDCMLSSAGTDPIHPQLALSPADDSYLVVWHTWCESCGTDVEADVSGTVYRPQRHEVWLPLFAAQVRATVL